MTAISTKPCSRAVHKSDDSNLQLATIFNENASASFYPFSSWIAKLSQKIFLLPSGIEELPNALSLSGLPKNA